MIRLCHWHFPLEALVPLEAIQPRRTRKRPRFVYTSRWWRGMNLWQKNVYHFARTHHQRWYVTRSCHSGIGSKFRWWFPNRFSQYGLAANFLKAVLGWSFGLHVLTPSKIWAQGRMLQKPAKDVQQKQDVWRFQGSWIWRISKCGLESNPWMRVVRICVHLYACIYNITMENPRGVWENCYSPEKIEKYHLPGKWISGWKTLSFWNGFLKLRDMLDFWRPYVESGDIIWWPLRHRDHLDVSFVFGGVELEGVMSCSQ